MTRELRISIVLGVAMLLTALATCALTPSTRLADGRTRFDLAASIPTRFPGWEVDTTLVPIAPNPESQAALDRIYDQTLARTYVDVAGQRVMLSIAYGGDQSKALQLHLPEVCYGAQGFQIVQKGEGSLATGFGQLPLKRLVARADMRIEPISYWITVGDRATRAGIAQKLQLLAYGLSGKIPDGMLVRISSISSDAPAAYQVQDGFTRALLAALTPQVRTRLLGTMTMTMASPVSPVHAMMAPLPLPLQAAAAVSLPSTIAPPSAPAAPASAPVPVAPEAATTTATKTKTAAGVAFPASATPLATSAATLPQPRAAPAKHAH